MKNYTIFLVLACLFLFAGILTAQDKTYTISETNITELNGEAFNISLAANHSTGYSWTAEVSDPAIVGIEGSDYVVPEKKVLGKAGDEVWHFRGVMQGSVTITFKYARPFDVDTVPANTVIFNITIQ